MPSQRDAQPAWPEAARPDAGWPEPPRQDRSASWPDTSPQGGSPAWPDAPPQDIPRSRPETPPQGGPSSWPDAPPQAGPPSRPDAPPQGGAPSWPDASPQAVPSSWPDAPSRSGSPSWPDAQPQTGPSSWSDAAPQGATPSWPEASQRGGPTSWPEAAPQGGPASWPEAAPQGGPASWPEAAPQSTTGAASRADSRDGSRADARDGSRADARDGSRADSRSGSRAEQPQVPDPVPAWAQAPAPAPGAWSNLSTPAAWPQGDQRGGADAPDQRAAAYDQAAPPGPPPHGPPPPAHPSEERTITYAQHSENLLNDRAVPSTPMDSTHIGTPPTEDQNNHPPGAPRPGSNLSRDPSDPEHRFVTAGQISGSRTPPPERQQELWNTVFGDNYQAMGDQEALDDDEGQGKPVWIYALGGSVVIALVAALLWAFLAGPLAGAEPTDANLAAGKPTQPQKPTATRTSTTIGPLPKYSGKASPVLGALADPAAGISVPRLGGNWQVDQRATVRATYQFNTRQYVQVAPEKYAQILSGPLLTKLASYYEQDNLEPVIKQVVLNARKRFFPADNKVRKIAQQSIKVGDQTGRLIAYSLTSQTEKATIVTMAVNTGRNVPAIVYMSIPSESKQLMPDIRTVMNQLKLTATS
ncbi:hypothetical protein [Nonomuraea sp. NPDC049480]|uniref:hypothetical protein n=1 Tax=Nonomuraea sp. NPDC049480 TaxID=3364353 RepID=UPI0037A6BD37